ncbi:MAG: 30S ribosomal protein S16 [Alphaproteobacteria bacterium ADurb.Bin438]|nr:MAG: 30S ribosomal protein S16 [Alphaproteobacteria bacterium ADurb.Bin438]
MSVKIRLARGGSKKRPFHKIVAADSRAPRDGKYIEKLGTYNPLLPKEHELHLSINSERVQYWLGVGAEATDRVAKLLSGLGLTKAPAVTEQPKKSAPKAKAQKRLEEEAAKKAAAEEASKEG